MKAKLIIILAASMLLLAGCTGRCPSIKEISLAGDKTEKFIAKPQSEEIRPLFGLDKDEWNGVIFRYTDVSDVSLNHVYEARIEPENQLLSNELFRKQKVNDFNSKVDSIINNSDKEKTGKEYSSVYIPIANELNHLSQSKSETRTFVCYSNLMENNRLSFYKSQTLNAVKSNPDSISKYFESLVPLKRLDGIKVYLIYQPTGNQEDEQFKIVSDFYKNMLESKGAKVEIAANLINDKAE